VTRFTSRKAASDHRGAVKWLKMEEWARPRRGLTTECESSQEFATSRLIADEWLWGWEPTPGIVSVWAEADSRAVVWRRLAGTGDLICEEERFRPWILLDRLDDLLHLGGQLGREGTVGTLVTYSELIKGSCRSCS
jgi:hypothetical protein